mmetsp:Transcript_1678/g.5409  ORF Transcript_1678/g.5409 Transcript_1678/m.5409 type:complete len:228 (-) Transcript_1678:425-1108(-)
MATSSCRRRVRRPFEVRHCHASSPPPSGPTLHRTLPPLSSCHPPAPSRACVRHTAICPRSARGSPPTTLTASRSCRSTQRPPCPSRRTPTVLSVMLLTQPSSPPPPSSSYPPRQGRPTARLRLSLSPRLTWRASFACPPSPCLPHTHPPRPPCSPSLDITADQSGPLTLPLPTRVNLSSPLWVRTGASAVSSSPRPRRTSTSSLGVPLHSASATTSPPGSTLVAFSP